MNLIQMHLVFTGKSQNMTIIFDIIRPAQSVVVTVSGGVPFMGKKHVCFTQLVTGGLKCVICNHSFA